MGGALAGQTGSFGTGQPSLMNYNDVLSGSLPCTAAALGSQDGPVLGRGLYVSMQRGMSYDSSELHTSFEINSRKPDDEGLPRRPARIRAESPGRMIPASNYEGAAEDPIDEVVAAECKQLLPHRAKALLIRRIAPGEYEVDGAPVRFSWARGDCNSNEVVVSTPGRERDGSEPLARYLPRAAEAALARSTEIELPAFPWPFDPLAKSTPSGQFEAPAQSLSHVMPPRLPRGDQLGKTMPSRGSHMLPQQPGGSHMIPQQPGAGINGPSLSAVVPITGSRARCIPRQPSMIVSSKGGSISTPMQHSRNLQGGYPRRFEATH